VIDNLKLYMAIIYIRRLEKAGYFGEKKKKQFGTVSEFTRLFGTEVKDE
jgi:hypothetical protein